MKGKDDRKHADCKPFTLDDVRQLLMDRERHTGVRVSAGPPFAKAQNSKQIISPASVTPARSFGAKEKKSASVLDILGFNPYEQQSTLAAYGYENIPQKWKKYYDQLIDMREQLERRVSFLAKDTLEQSAVGEGGGGLNMLGQHMADGAAQQVDLELALTFVATEKDLLNEVNDALARIRDGTYGICQQTGQTIEPKRLAVLPFARFSLQGQQEYERAKLVQSKKQRQGAIFVDSGEGEDLLPEDEIEEK